MTYVFRGRELGKPDVLVLADYGALEVGNEVALHPRCIAQRGVCKGAIMRPSRLESVVEGFVGLVRVLKVITSLGSLLVGPLLTPICSVCCSICAMLRT